MEDFEGLIFDCDGTLTDSMPLHFISWRDTLANYGLTFPEDRFYGLAGMPSERIIHLLASEQGKNVDAEPISNEKEAAFLELIDQLEPIHHVVELVKAAHGNKPISVASGGIRPVVEQQLCQIGLREFFQVIVTAEDTERHKPEPDVFLLAAKLMDVPPERCCVYEDSDLGIQAAETANMGWVDIREFHTPRRIT